MDSIQHSASGPIDLQKPSLTAEDVKTILGLRPHPCEGGSYVRSYESGERVPAEAFADRRYPGPRFTSTAIYYLLEPETFSEMHQLRSDELFHFYGGDALEMLQLAPGGPGRVLRIGMDLRAGERPQVLAPRGVWQGSRLVPGGRWALLGCTVAPGFEFEDYEAGRRAELLAGWPEFRGADTGAYASLGAGGSCGCGVAYAGRRRR